MIRKILILALVTFSLAICGCTQDLPPAPQTENQTQTPNAKIETDNPTKIQTVQEKKNPPENPKVNEPPKVVSPATENKSTKMKVKVYFPDDAGINLVAVARSIEIHNESEKYPAVVNLLMQYPNEKDLTVIFPKNAKINSVTFKDGTAFVDFDANITKSFAGGSTGEELLVGSVVRTLTEFKEVKQVRFLVDGKEIETLSGHMDLSAPVKKSDL